MSRSGSGPFTPGTAVAAGAVGLGLLLLFLSQGAWPALAAPAHPVSATSLPAVAAPAAGPLDVRWAARPQGDPFTLVQDGVRKDLQLPVLPPPPIALPEPPLLPLVPPVAPQAAVSGPERSP